MMAASTATSAIHLRLPISTIRAFPYRRHRSGATPECAAGARAAGHLTGRSQARRRGPRATSGLRQAHAGRLVRLRFETGGALLDLGAARPFARRLHALLRLPVLLEIVAAQDRRDLVAGQRLVLEQRLRDVVERGAVVEQQPARALVLFL